MSGGVSLGREGNIGVVTVANPPVNALSHAVRSGIWSAIHDTDADDTISAVVLICDGRGFIAGADIREFGQPPRAPLLGDVVFALQQAGKPWVAAIHGMALGGGVEIALGCRHRIAEETARLGFPEVNLGLIPGAGGTILLPRCIAMHQAIEMITRGKPVSATKAREDGLVDEIIRGGLRAAAIEYARQLDGKADRGPLFQDKIIAPLSKDAIRDIRHTLERRHRAQRAPLVALDTILHVAGLPVREARAHERKQFDILRQSTQAKALRHIFLAERATARIDALKGVAPRPFGKIGIVGGGTMGSGIAAACLLHGCSVTLVETGRSAAEKGAGRISAILAESHRRGLVSTGRKDQLEAALSAHTDYGALKDADLIVEAVFEDMEVKQGVFRQLDAHSRPDAILASNTSYLDINAIAGVVRDPGRVIGLHFFSPAHIMKLLEIIRTDHALPDVLATGFALARTLKKIPVIAGMCDGFIGNRIMSAYRREADYLIEEGAMPDQVDTAMREFGFPIGIFQMQDLAGLDIAWAMRKRQASARTPSQRYVGIADRLCELERFGRKSGAGWYSYQGAKPCVDPVVTQIIDEERRRKSIQPGTFSKADIMDRILDSMHREATQVLEEGIARSRDDIDVVLVNGYGFPRWKGGPMFMQAQPGGKGKQAHHTARALTGHSR